MLASKNDKIKMMKCDENDDSCHNREEESRNRLEERGGALDGYIKGWNRCFISTIFALIFSSKSLLSS